MQEEDFIIAELSIWVRKTDADINPQDVKLSERKVNVRKRETPDPEEMGFDGMKRGTTTEVWGDGEEGYVPWVSFARNYPVELDQDFDRDGSAEIIFDVLESGGGVGWYTFHSLEKPARGGYKLHRLELPCSCPRKAWCPDSPRDRLKGVSGRLIAVESCCRNYEEIDIGWDECCDEILFKYAKGKLKRHSFKTSDCAEKARAMAEAKREATAR